MKRYLKIYLTLIRLNFSVLLSYRMNFINSIISTVGWGLFQVVFIFLITSKTKSVFGWSRNELMLLAISYVIIIGVFHFLFSRNFDRFSHMIDYGDLDMLLVKPVDSQFLVSAWYISYANLLRVLLGIILMIYLLNKMFIVVTLGNILGYLSLSFFGIMLLYSVWFICSTIIIWFPRLTNLVDLLYTVNGIARYPTEMLTQVRSFLFLFLIPFTFTIATPIKALLNKVLTGDIVLLLLVSLALFFISRKFWKFALRYYTSASS